MNEYPPEYDRIKILEDYAEKVYDEMYEASSTVGAGAYFSEWKIKIN